MQTIFIDTEFADLYADTTKYNKSWYHQFERRQEFYYELTDTYTVADCSQFVIKYVLPKLRITDKPGLAH